MCYIYHNSVVIIYSAVVNTFYRSCFSLMSMVSTAYVTHSSGCMHTHAVEVINKWNVIDVQVELWVILCVDLECIIIMLTCMCSDSDC